MAHLSVRSGLLAGAAACALIATAAAQDNIGVTAAVNPNATGTPPERATRTLNVGLDMFRNEKIVTGPVGKTQLLFIDGSALSIGPNSEVVLDEFVYDPQTETGKLAMTATKGVFRLVGGKLSKTEPVTLKTPTATIGIRGGVGTVVLPGTGAGPPPFVSLDFGKALTVNGQGADGQPTNVMVTRPGTGVTFGPGGTVGAPGPIPQALLAGALNAVEGSRGQSGGAREQPTDTRVAQAGVGEQGSANAPEAVRVAENVAADISNVATDVFDSVQLAQASQTEFAPDPGSSSSSSSSPGFSGSTRLSGRYKTTPGGSSTGTADASTFFNQLFFGDIVGSLFQGFTLGSGFSGSSMVPYTAPVTGTLLETTARGSYFSFGDAGTTSLFGPLAGKVFVSNMNDYVIYFADETDFFDDKNVAFAGVPTPPATVLPLVNNVLTYRLDGDFVLNTNLAFLRSPVGGNLAGVRSNVYVSPGLAFDPTLLQGNLAIVGSGTSQQSAASFGIGRLVGSLLGTNLNLDGRVRGTSRMSSTGGANFVAGPLGMSTDGLGNAIYGTDGPNFFLLESSSVPVGAPFSGDFDAQATAIPTPGGLGESLGTSPNFGTTYFPNNFAQRIANPGGVGVSRQSVTYNRGFANGYIDAFNSGGTFLSSNNQFKSASNGTGVSIATDAARNTISGSFSGNFSATNFVLPFGSSTNDGRGAFIDDKLYGAVEASSGAMRGSETPGQFFMYVVSNDLVQASSLLAPSGASFCNTCTNTTFNFWGIDLIHSTGRDRVHLGQAVAAMAPVNVPLGGSATYSGFAVADVATNAGARYKVGGAFSMTYTFSSPTASAMPWTVTFDASNTITGSGSGTGGAPTFSGSYTGNVPGIMSGSGTFNGVFGGGSIGVIPPEVVTQFEGTHTGGTVIGVTQGKVGGGA
jgi:trimeric autotransporter adhesin